MTFFCLSGFVIGTNRRLPTSEFAARRILRIYPAYWIACAIALFLAELVQSPISIGSWTELLLLLPTKAVSPVNVMYWTLVYEVFFYALATAVFAMRLPDNTLTILIIAWMIAIHLSVNNTAVLDVAQPGWWIAVSRYNQFFAIGLLCAIHLDRMKSIASAVYMSAALVSFSASQLTFLHWSVLWALLYAIFLSSIMMATIHVVRIHRILFILGEASYGIYLTHYFVIISLIPIGRQLGLSMQAVICFVFVVALGVGIAFGLFEARLYKRLTKLLWSHPSSRYQKQAAATPSPSLPN